MITASKSDSIDLNHSGRNAVHTANCHGGRPAMRSRKLLTFCLVAAAFLTLPTAPALAGRGHSYEPNLVIGEPCTAEPCAPGTLKKPSGIAVNEATDELYVVDSALERIERFDAGTGAFLGQFDGTETTAGNFNLISAIAVDNDPSSPSHGDVYIADNRDNFNESGANRVDKFTQTGTFITQLRDFSEFSDLAGLAVDEGGGLYVLAENKHVYSFTNAVNNVLVKETSVEGSLRFGHINGLARDSAGAYYIRSGNGGVRSESPPDRILKAIPNPNPEQPWYVVSVEEVDYEESTSVAVESGSDVVFIDNLTSVAAFSPSGIELERFDFGGNLVEGAGIAVDVSSGFAYVADSASGHVLVLGPEPPGAPLVEPNSQGVLEVAATSATVKGEVNPHSRTGEEPTTYRFEYGPCDTVSTCAASPFTFSTAPRTLPPDSEVHPVTGHITGLEPHRPYHFRLVAENSHDPGAPVLGEEGIFITQAVAPFALLDGRAWELVSPPDKLGADLLPIGGALVQSSASGNAFTFVANAPTEPNPPGNTTSKVQVIAGRSIPTGASAWSSRDIITPYEATTGAGFSAGAEFKFFAEDLATSVVEPFRNFNPALTAEDPPFLRTNYLEGTPTAFCTSSCYRSITGASGQFRGGSPDGRHLVLTASAPLLEGAPGNGLYMWSEGQLQLVSILPGGAPAPEASAPLLGDEKPGGVGNGAGAISVDGSRVVWVEGGGAHHLFLNDTVTGESTQLDSVHGGTGKGAVGPHFQAASDDGSLIFFTDEQRLTPDSGAAAGKADLYQCLVEENEENGELECSLTDLSPGHNGESAEVQGTPGASADGGVVYYVAHGALTGAEENQRGETAQAGQANLFLSHEGGLTFVATLDGVDSPVWSTGNPTERLARVSPNGRWFAFMSQRPLSGYDNTDAVSGKKDQEVYLYEAPSGASQGNLICASCNPTGARPHGVIYSELAPGKGGLALARIFGYEQGGKEATIAANVPGWTSARETGGLYQSRYLSNTGRLFFDSSDALFPTDSNGTGDVYEYEPAGVGSCTDGSPAFSEKSGGCIDLVTSGTSDRESAFLDASEGGEDVFFLTHSQLRPSRDTDTAIDVYDARVGGGEPEPVQPVTCEGDGCQQPVAPPSDSTPGSLTFHGAGNVPKAAGCPKRKVRTRGKCVGRHHKKKHHKKSAKPANANRGGAR